MGLPAGTYQVASASYLDAGDELGNMRIFGKVITAANEVAQAAAWADVLDAVDALSLGTRKRDTYNDKTTYDVVAPTNGAAREIALRAKFHDTVNGQIWLDTVVPCLNNALIDYIPGGKDVVDQTTTEIAALIDALEAFPVVNPYAQANAVEVLALYVVRGQK
jgi:hypothetical protein